ATPMPTGPTSRPFVTPRHWHAARQPDSRTRNPRHPLALAPQPAGAVVVLGGGAGRDGAAFVEIVAAHGGKLRRACQVHDGVGPLLGRLRTPPHGEPDGDAE